MSISFLKKSVKRISKTYLIGSGLTAVQFKDDVARPAPLLARPGKAPRIQEQDPVAVFGDRDMGVAVNSDLRVPAGRFPQDPVIGLKDIAAVSVRHIDPAGFKFYYALIRRVREEVVVAGNRIKGSAAEFSVDQLAPLEVPGMQENIKSPLFGQHIEENVVLCVRISDDQDFHK